MSPGRALSPSRSGRLVPPRRGRPGRAARLRRGRRPPRRWARRSRRCPLLPARRGRRTRPRRPSASPARAGAAARRRTRCTGVGSCTCSCLTPPTTVARSSSTGRRRSAVLSARRGHAGTLGPATSACQAIAAAGTGGAGRGRRTALTAAWRTPWCTPGTRSPPRGGTGSVPRGVRRRRPQSGAMTDDLPLADLLAYDRQHLWHPYSSALAPSTPYLVESAAGVRLRLRLPGGEPREVDRRDVVVVVRDPRLRRARARRRRPRPARPDEPRDVRRPHPRAGDQPGPAAGRPRAARGRTSPLQHVFLADSGSVSVEVAMKMALAAARQRRPAAHGRCFTVRGGYHGDTFSADERSPTRSAACTRSSPGCCPSRSSRRGRRPARPARRRPGHGRLGAGDARAVRRARRRGRGGHRRAGAAGRRRDARLQPARRARAAPRWPASTARW